MLEVGRREIADVLVWSSLAVQAYAFASIA
jgi:hypothetical protein